MKEKDFVIPIGKTEDGEGGARCWLALELFASIVCVVWYCCVRLLFIIVIVTGTVFKGIDLLLITSTAPFVPQREHWHS